MSEVISRQFEEITVEYPNITDKEHKGKPYYSIKYVEDGEEYIGYGTYKIEVLSRYIRDYFIPSADLSDYCDRLWKLAYERGKAEIIRCKDCKYWISNGCKEVGCLEYDFCSYAERRGDSDE